MDLNALIEKGAPAKQAELFLTDLFSHVIDGMDAKQGAYDPAALAAVIDELLADPAQRRRLALNGAGQVADRFDRDVNIEELTALFTGRVARGVEAARGASR